MTSNSWEVGPLERDAAEESLRKQKANNVKFHSLPFLVRKGNKGLTLTSAILIYKHLELSFFNIFFCSM
jgi:hypothetical protein